MKSRANKNKAAGKKAPMPKKFGKMPMPAPKAYARGGRVCMATGGAAKQRLGQDTPGRMPKGGKDFI